MTNGIIQTYAVVQERVTVFEDTELSKIASGVYMARGATFSGESTNRNNTIHLTNGSGFVPADAVALCYRYSVNDTTRVLQDHRSDALQALGGAAFKHPGEAFDAAQAYPGWLWLLDGIGYIPATNAQIVGVTPSSQPGIPSPSNGQRTYVVEDGDTLSGISAKFYDGDQSRYMDIYNVPENQARIGGNPGQLSIGTVLIIP